MDNDDMDLESDGPFFALTAEDTEMPFGKHAGEELRDIPNSYLKWLLENIDEGNFGELLDDVQEVLDNRTTPILSEKEEEWGWRSY